MKIAVLPGDGIGKEVVPVAVEVIRSVMPAAEIIPVDVGYERFLPRRRRDDRRGYGPHQVAVTVSCSAPSPPPPKKCYKSVILSLRAELDLYANIRPFRSFGISPFSLDFTIYRENSEDLYCGMEDVREDEVLSTQEDHPPGQRAHRACGLPEAGHQKAHHRPQGQRAAVLRAVPGRMHRRGKTSRRAVRGNAGGHDGI